MKKFLIVTLLSGISTLAAMEQGNFEQKDVTEEKKITDEIIERKNKKRKVTQQDINQSLRVEPSVTLFNETVDSLDTAYRSLKKLDRKDKNITKFMRHVLKTVFKASQWDSGYSPSDIVKKRVAEEVLIDIQEKDSSSDSSQKIDSKSIFHECLIQYAKKCPQDITTEVNNLVDPEAEKSPSDTIKLFDSDGPIFPL